MKFVLYSLLMIALSVLFFSAHNSAAENGNVRLQVAVTIDDLPWVGSPPSEKEALKATDQLLATLKKHRIKATGFVICGRAADGVILRKWLESGMELGNHTSNHLDLNNVTLEEWVQNAKTCHDYLTKLQGHPPRYFRYPYLHEGDTQEKLNGAKEALKSMGYTNAVVTIDNADWMLARFYQTASNENNPAVAQKVAQEYSNHINGALQHFDEAALDAFGSRIPQILLLHANLLGADHLDEILKEYSSRNVEFIDLETALKHPAFSQKTSYIGRSGLSWIYRASPKTHEKMGAWDDEQLDAMQKQFPEYRNQP